MASHHQHSADILPLHRVVPLLGTREEDRSPPPPVTLAAQIEARLRDDRPVHLEIEELRQRRRDEAEYDEDLHIIGIALGCGYAFVCIARLAQVVG